MNTIHFCHQETCKYKQILRTKSFFSKKIAEFAIILELNGYSGCMEIG